MKWKMKIIIIKIMKWKMKIIIIKIIMKMMNENNNKLKLWNENWEIEKMKNENNKWLKW